MYSYSFFILFIDFCAFIYLILFIDLFCAFIYLMHVFLSRIFLFYILSPFARLLLPLSYSLISFSFLCSLFLTVLFCLCPSYFFAFLGALRFALYFSFLCFLYFFCFSYPFFFYAVAVVFALYLLIILFFFYNGNESPQVYVIILRFK